MTPLRQRMLEEMQIRNFSSENTRKLLPATSVTVRSALPPISGKVSVLPTIRDYQLYLDQREEARTGIDSHREPSAPALSVRRGRLKAAPGDVEEVLPMPKKPEKLPVILSPEEVRHFLSCIPRRKARTAPDPSVTPLDCASRKRFALKTQRYR